MTTKSLSSKGDDEKYHPAPWIKKFERHPELIWYWMREGTYQIPKTCLEMKRRQGSHTEDNTLKGINIFSLKSITLLSINMLLRIFYGKLYFFYYRLLQCSYMSRKRYHVSASRNSIHSPTSLKCLSMRQGAMHFI